MVKIASFLFAAALFGAAAVAQPVNPNVVVVTVVKTAVAAPVPVNKNVVVKTVFETVYANAVATPIAHDAELTTSASSVPVAPTSAPVAPAAPAAPVVSVAPATKTSAPAQTQAPAPPTSDSWQTDMLNQVNAVRAKVGKAALTMNSVLTTLAQDHSNYMSSTSDMTHSDPSGSLGARFSAIGLAWQGAAENIAWNQQNVDEVMQAWINSPGHYANMIGDYTSVGFGVTNLYWTQDFVKN
ncbi:hypothetical protein GGI04_003694 [Coemansia thaxteri]|uniref:SCP domain-containing protein n=1 Tax=Coemansia thaxteri TaxID=2663907 RepID=A0A9W8EHU8_9FUNG|nr:hypothetical protein H4R26_004145 [Coemansia thaxteri]KAJ2001541.1 hypothetical protein GGI04_003694 [Coemansia thaxteri]KAJ2465207.1 hypothetical protein GGI02_004768 [Coemansia sp. RSA 2322]KAJ2480070.1 hypothetical protein EV174_003829 [Coemansia sp. RSA 2320]